MLEGHRMPRAGRRRRHTLAVMGKVLLAVGSFLAFCFLIFGGVVFLNRKEDRVAVDALLAENISKAVVTAEQNHTPLDLRNVTPFDWDEVYVFPINASRRTY